MDKHELGIYKIDSFELGGNVIYQGTFRECFDAMTARKGTLQNGECFDISELDKDGNIKNSCGWYDNECKEIK